jgi:uncharacterized membrane protein
MSADTSSTSASSFLQRLGRELFGFDRPETTGDYLHFRVLELLLVGAAIHLCWTWGFYIHHNVSTPLLELGIAQYLDVSFMFDHYVAVGNAVLIIVLLALGLFRVWRPAYFGALLLFHLQYVSRYILGEISHGSNFVGMGVLALGLTHLVFTDPQRRRRFTFGFLYFFIGLGYTSAGMSKLIGTGITWADGHHLWMWIAERKVDVMGKFGAFEPNLLQELILSDVTVATLVLTFGHLVELSGFLVWWRRFRYPVMGLLVSMHVGIAFSMNIMFWWTTIILVLLMLPWGSLYDQLRETNPELAMSTE